MNSAVFILVGVAMLSVVIVLLMGVFSMAKGGTLNDKYGNRLMQARVVLQGLAVALLALAYFAS